MNPSKTLSKPHLEPAICSDVNLPPNIDVIRHLELLTKDPTQSLNAATTSKSRKIPLKSAAKLTKRTPKPKKKSVSHILDFDDDQEETVIGDNDPDNASECMDDVLDLDNTSENSDFFIEMSESEGFDDYDDDEDGDGEFNEDGDEYDDDDDDDNNNNQSYSDGDDDDNDDDDEDFKMVKRGKRSRKISRDDNGIGNKKGRKIKKVSLTDSTITTTTTTTTDDGKKNDKKSGIVKKSEILSNSSIETDIGIQYNTSSIINHPNFYNHVYCIKRLTPTELPFFTAGQFSQAFAQFRYYQQRDSKNSRIQDKSIPLEVSASTSRAAAKTNRDNQHYNFKTKLGYELCMCQIHGPTVQNFIVNKNICETCVPFLTFSYSFVMETSVHLFTFPMPTLFTPQLVNFFRSIVIKATENSLSKEDQVTTERIYYNTFINKKFVGGNLSTIIAGKNSWMRKKMLAFSTHGIRMTLTVHSELGPHYVRIPRKLYEAHRLATPLAIVNRSPSINSRCIYVVELMPHDDDDTIHLNPYILDGLHADQDGDDIQVFLFLKQSEVPSFEMETCIKELRNFSWKYGKRHDCIYMPRYSFSQYHRFLLHHKSDYFAKHSILWASLPGTPIQKAKTIMNLGCSIMPREVDEFIRLVSRVTEYMSFHSISVTDILNGNGQMLDIVESEAKGTKDHIDLVTKNLMTIPDDFESTMIDNGFNKFVNSSLNMSREGVTQFTMLYAYNSICLHRGNYQLNGVVILRDDNESAQLTTQLYYNHDAVNFTFQLLLDDDTLEELYDFDGVDKDLAEFFTIKSS